MSKKMRRMITIVLSLIMLCSLSITALADTTGTTTVRIMGNGGGASGGTWELHVPASLTIETGTNSTNISAYVSASGGNEGDLIEIYLEHTGYFVSAQDSNDKVGYTIGTGIGGASNITPGKNKVASATYYGGYWQFGAVSPSAENTFLKISDTQWAQAKNGVVYSTTLNWSSEYVPAN